MVLAATRETGNGKTVCVTGAGGFIASWLVKLLLEKGYAVKGTVKNPGSDDIMVLIINSYVCIELKILDLFNVVDDSKNDHLKAMEGAAERLTLCKADLLDYDALLEAMLGCHGVFHTAFPITDDPEQVLEPAVRGTRNVINAAAEAGTVRRLVFTSSIGAVTMDPNRGPEVVVDETCWSDLEFCKNTKNWYCYGKTMAEQVAWEAAREKGVELAVVIPALVLGPLLQPQVNASAAHILKYLDGSVTRFVNAVQGYVDVRDVAVAHLLVFEATSISAGGKRFICAERILHRDDVVRALAKLFPEYPVPDKCSDEVNPRKKPYDFSNQPLKQLGVEFRPVSQSLYETVKSLQEKGHLPRFRGN